jgi:DNA-binding PadR family transcriptional regulator
MGDRSSIDDDFKSLVNLEEQELVRCRPHPDLGSGVKLWELTEKGEAYVDALLRVPFPVQKWTIPEGG